ncbi:ABC transporter substrate-binding protein [Litorihabitans aurantiacus]|uniref:Sugar ABC transporter substrate-binding protein n=1 Tax=Litorihabitans aurantiacus TaxID=1930061 RepID=A0AA37XHZ9_9MICO|nr:extracellular solute-binding protein [Litorihabitans aurantiacus]GMA33364.1 sugar ABC transporter substrate-binding protein [Litorihabitans aurantiacus]
MSRRDALRLGATAAGGAALASLLAACGGSPRPTATAGPVTLSFWTHDEGYVNFFTEALPLVAERTPFDPRLSITRSGASDLVTKLLAQAIAGTGTPDVAGLEIGQFTRLLRGDIAAELLVDLAPAVADLGDDLMAARTAPFSKDGALYALDSDTPMTVYYYREDLFEQHGVPLPQEAGTWEEFMAAVAPISERTGTAFGALSLSSDLPQVISSFHYLLLQRGGQLFTPDGELSITTPEAEEVLTLMTQGLTSGAFTTVSDYYGGSVQSALSSDSIAGICMPSWYASYGIKPNVPEQSGRWRVAELPRFSGGGGRTAVGGGTGFAALRAKPGTTAATDLVTTAYLSPEQQVLRYRELGYMPTLRSVYDLPEMYGLQDEFFGGQDVFEVFHEIVDDAPPVYQTADLAILNTVLSGRLIEAYRGVRAPAEALSLAAEDFRGQTRGTGA